MKRIAISLILVISMLLSMMLPVFAASVKADEDAEVTLLLLPKGSKASDKYTEVEVGDTIEVVLTVFFDLDGEEANSAYFDYFENTITFNDDVFVYDPDSVECADGFEVDVDEEDRITIYGSQISGIDNGDVLLTFELEAIDEGKSKITQLDEYKISTTKKGSGVYYEYYDRYGDERLPYAEIVEYADVYRETGDIRAVEEGSDTEYSIKTYYDDDRATIYLTEGATSLAGEEVRFRVVLKKNQIIEELIAYYEDEEEDEIVELRVRSSTDSNGSKYYYFTMPKADVNIELICDGEDVSSGKEHDVYIEYVGNSHKLAFAYADTYSAVEDEKVYITVDTFSTDYEIKSVKVYDTDDNAVSVSLRSGKYRFTMPDDDVIVEVEVTGTYSSAGQHLINDYSDDRYGYVYMPETAKKDQTVKISVDPEENYLVEKVIVTTNDGKKTVTVEENSSNNYYSFKMPDNDVEVEVVFIHEKDADKEYDIYLDLGDDNGTAKLSKTKAKYDAKVKITINPDTGYKLDTLKIEDELGDEIEYDDDDPYYTFYMPRDNVYIYVDFKKDSSSSSTTTTTYDIDLSYNSSNGTVTTSKSTAAKNKAVEIYATPKSGYVVDTVKVTKKSSSSISVTVTELEDSDGETYYTFKMPAYAVKVSVTFKKDENAEAGYKVTLATDVKNGSVTASGTRADVGERVKLTPKPNSGYELDELTVKNASGAKLVLTKNSDGTYIFTMPSSNVTVSATFKKKEEATTTTPSTSTTTPPTSTTTPPTSTTTPTFTLPADSPAKNFTDIDTTAWYMEAVHYAVTNNLMKGTGDGTTFAPNMTASRGMIVTMIRRLAGNPVSEAVIPYTDVPEGEWYTEAIRWAYANNMLLDIAISGAFEPNADLTREQIASILYRYELYEKNGVKETITNDLTKFTDATDISSWAVEAVRWCNAKGIMNGTSTTTFSPKKSVTRAELAQILVNYAKLNAAEAK